LCFFIVVLVPNLPNFTFDVIRNFWAIGLLNDEEQFIQARIILIGTGYSCRKQNQKAGGQAYFGNCH